MDGIASDLVIQYGFAGVCVILLVMLSGIGVAFFWMVRKLISLLEESNRVIAQNSSVFEKLTATWDALEKRIGDVLEIVKAK